MCSTSYGGCLVKKDYVPSVDTNVEVGGKRTRTKRVGEIRLRGSLVGCKNRDGRC